VREVEIIRRSFRPQRITTLFVGESAPYGENFFYRENSQVYAHMKEAFGGEKNFLEQFKAKGYFLDDLILQPVNQMDRRIRRQLRFENITSLAERISDYRPANVVILMMAIEPMVRDAVAKAGLSDCPVYATPFPGNGQQRRFRLRMKEIIPNL
jgi:hypothetical protein